MARTAKDTEVTQHIVTDQDTPGLENMAEAVNTLAAMENEAGENAVAVARQMGYDGTLTVGGLEDEIRFYQRRTAEACLELGKRLLILKELTPHGEFTQRVELLGIGYQSAKKFMAATMKLSKRVSNTFLEATTQTKMLELLVLDDGEIDALEQGDTVRGLTLDSIEMMSVSELKKALREAKDNAAAKDQVIRGKTEQLDKQTEQIALLEHRQRTATVDELTLQARDRLQAEAAQIKASIMTSLRKAVKDLYEHPGDHASLAAGCLIEIGRELAMLRGEYQLPSTVSEDLMPEWLDASALADIEAMADPQGLVN